MATHLIALSHKNYKELEGKGERGLEISSQVLCLHSQHTKKRNKDHIPHALNVEQQLEAEIGETATTEQPQL